VAAPSADVVVLGTGAMTGAGEPSWSEKRTAPKVSFGFSPIKKIVCSRFF